MKRSLSLVLLVMSLHCTKPVDPEDLPRIELTAENIVSKEVWLRLNFVNVQLYEYYLTTVDINGNQTI